MIGHVLSQVIKLKISKAVVVIAPGMESVKKAAGAEYKNCEFAEQKDQLGTGHKDWAAAAACPALQSPALLVAQAVAAF